MLGQSPLPPTTPRTPAAPPSSSGDLRDLRLPEDPPRPAPPTFSDLPLRDGPAPQSHWNIPPAPPRPDHSQPLSGRETAPYTSDVGQKKLIAGLLAICLGSFGVHKFYLGMNTPGLWMLFLTVVFPVAAFIFMFLTIFIGFPVFLLGAIAPSVMALVGLIEGIIYLTKTNTDFEREYLVHHREWF